MAKEEQTEIRQSHTSLLIIILLTKVTLLLQVTNVSVTPQVTCRLQVYCKNANKSMRGQNDKRIATFVRSRKFSKAKHFIPTSKNNFYFNLNNIYSSVKQFTYKLGIKVAACHWQVFLESFGYCRKTEINFIIKASSKNKFTDLKK